MSGKVAKRYFLGDYLNTYENPRNQKLGADYRNKYRKLKKAYRPCEIDEIEDADWNPLNKI